MKSDLPKVMHKLAGKPLIAHALASAAALKPANTVVVVAPGMESVKAAVKQEKPDSVFTIQKQPKGTGHAVASATGLLSGETILVLYGDTPLITTHSLSALLTARKEKKCVIALLGMKPLDPTGYGRLVMRKEPYVERIVECKDATPTQKKISWVWGGVMAFDGAFLREALPKLKPSKVTGELYLTTLIEMATAEGKRTVMVPMNEEEAMGINDRSQLAAAEHVMQRRLRARAMEQGATLIDPDTVYFSGDTKLGTDVIIHPHVVFGPGVTVESSVEIRSFSHIEGARIRKHAVIGPFARIRPGSEIGEHAHVGNFVEIKKSVLGKGAKANHLSYIGDAEVGADANIGAGTITCNYDGAKKHKTIIGEGAFIGSNTALIAPVKVGKGALVGAGSVITEDVKPHSLAIARARQIGKSKKRSG